MLGWGGTVVFVRDAKGVLYTVPRLKNPESSENIDQVGRKIRVGCFTPPEGIKKQCQHEYRTEVSTRQFYKGVIEAKKCRCHQYVYEVFIVTLQVSFPRGISVLNDYTKPIKKLRLVSA